MTMPTPEIFGQGYDSIQVGLCQVEVERWAIEDNFKRTIEALREAGKQGAQLAITPENVLQGYPPVMNQDDAARLREMAEPLDGKYMQAVQKEAQDHSMDIVFGFTEKGVEGNYHNSCAYISKTGKILAVYRKIHCRPFEDISYTGLFTPGKEFKMVETHINDVRCRIGMYICFDREIPESTRSLRALGTEFIACPLATNTSDLEAPLTRADNEMLTRARAAENEVFIAVVNHAKNYNGGTFVVGPSGELITQLGEGPEVRTIEVPIGAVASKFHSDALGWAGWGFRKPEVYRRYLN